MGMLDGRAGIVTGAASGIGRAMAVAFAADGAKVVVSDINEAGGAETVATIEKAGGHASFVRADTSDSDQVAAAVGYVVDTFGRLDWAVNNAGMGPPTVPLLDQERDWWDRTFSIDVNGVMFGLQHQIRQFVAQGTGGAIVNTASVAGLHPVAGLAPYVAAKHAVIGLTKNAALEYGPQGIRVNAICPGTTRTPAIDKWFAEVPEQAREVESKIPLGRVGTAEDQAQGALWLCSDRAAYVTGVALPIDGGDMLN